MGPDSSRGCIFTGLVLRLNRSQRSEKSDDHYLGQFYRQTCKSDIISNYVSGPSSNAQQKRCS